MRVSRLSALSPVSAAAREEAPTRRTHLRPLLLPAPRLVPASALVPSRALRTEARLAPEARGGSRPARRLAPAPRPRERADGRASGRGRSAAGGPCVAAVAWARAPVRAAGARLSARPEPLAPVARRSLCCPRGGGPGSRRNLPRRLGERSAERRELAGRDASGRRPPHTAPARAAPQPVPPARVPGPFPHRAGSRGHADGARMPHRGRELRGAGSHHLRPRAPLLPFLGRLLGECLRRRRGLGPGAAVAGTRPAPSGGADARVWLPPPGEQFPSPGRGTPGTAARRAAAPTRCAWSYFSEGKTTRRPPFATWWVVVGGWSLPGTAARIPARRRRPGQRATVTKAARGRPSRVQNPLCAAPFAAVLAGGARCWGSVWRGPTGQALATHPLSPGQSTWTYW